MKYKELNGDSFSCTLFFFPNIKNKILIKILETRKPEKCPAEIRLTGIKFGTLDIAVLKNQIIKLLVS